LRSHSAACALAAALPSSVVDGRSASKLCTRSRLAGDNAARTVSKLGPAAHSKQLIAADCAPLLLSHCKTLPQQVRGSLATYSQVTPASLAFDCCTGCGDAIAAQWRERGFDFVRQVRAAPSLAAASSSRAAHLGWGMARCKCAGPQHTHDGLMCPVHIRPCEHLQLVAQQRQH
jgi:hypothetical protein